MSSFEKFKENLPSKENSYSLLTNTKVSVVGSMSMILRYEMDLEWNWSQILLLADVLLLADAFQKFRNSSLKIYKSSLSHYISAPTLIWDATLNMTKADFELISDADIYFFFKRYERWSFLHFQNI